MPTTEIEKCPECRSALSEYEQQERECFTCGWMERPPVTDTLPNAPENFIWDRDNSGDSLG